VGARKRKKKKKLKPYATLVCGQAGGQRPDFKKGSMDVEQWGRVCALREAGGEINPTYPDKNLKATALSNLLKKCFYGVVQ